MRISSFPLLLVVVAGCAAPPSTRPTPGPLSPQPVAVEASGTLSTLIAALGDDPEELFSGKDMPDLARKVTQAARQRGYTEDVFSMSSEGSFRMGGSTMSLGLNPSEHLLQDFGLWLFRIPETDRTVPDRARG